MKLRSFSFPARFSLIFALLVVFALVASSPFAIAVGQATSGSPQNMGPEDESAQISVIVWLNPNDRAALDTLVAGMYDNSSARYHQFMTVKQLDEQFAPTAQQVGVVRDFLTSHNLRVTSTGPNNHFLVARGRVGDAQIAFNTRINRMMVNGRMHRVNESKPSVSGPAAALVASVQGLSDLRYRANVKPSTNFVTGAPRAGVLP